MKTYDVIRAHGDYEVGDTREGNPAELAHLIGKCLVEKKSTKAEPEVKNKMQKPLKNKAAK